MTPPDADFCSPFDAALAKSGVGAVFLVDREGALRFDSEWTRDAWGRAEATGDPTWALVRDRGSGHVQVVFVTRGELLSDHPRLQVRTCASADEARAARREIGLVQKEPW